VNNRGLLALAMAQLKGRKTPNYEICKRNAFELLAGLFTRITKPNARVAGLSSS
jgi:hypothetical protein